MFHIYNEMFMVNSQYLPTREGKKIPPLSMYFGKENMDKDNQMYFEIPLKLEQGKIMCRFLFGEVACIMEIAY